MKVMSKNWGSLSKVPDDLTAENSTGIFVCTHEKVLSLNKETLSNAMLLIDEVHMFIRVNSKLLSQELKTPIA